MVVMIIVVTVLAVGVAALLFLYVRLKSEVNSLEKQLNAQQLRTDRLGEEMAAERQRMTSQLAELLTQTNLDGPPVPVPSSLNMNKRSQAMRLLRTGNEVEAVASDLQLPKSEIRLLSKVQGILAAAAKSTS